MPLTHVCASCGKQIETTGFLGFPPGWFDVVSSQGKITLYSDLCSPKCLEAWAITEQQLEAKPPGDYRKARGVSPLRPGDPLPEETIRRMRDAW